MTRHGQDTTAVHPSSPLGDQRERSVMCWCGRFSWNWCGSCNQHCDHKQADGSHHRRWDDADNGEVRGR